MKRWSGRTWILIGVITVILATVAVVTKKSEVGGAVFVGLPVSKSNGVFTVMLSNASPRVIYAFVMLPQVKINAADWSVLQSPTNSNYNGRLAMGETRSFDVFVPSTIDRWRLPAVWIEEPGTLTMLHRRLRARLGGRGSAFSPDDIHTNYSIEMPAPGTAEGHRGK